MSAYFESVLREMENATDDITDTELLTMRTSKGKWSAAETLEHLTLTFSSTAKLMQKLSGSSPSVPQPTLKQRIATTIVVGLGHLPSGRKSPDFALPVTADLIDVRARFREALSEMDQQITSCERVHGTSKKVAAHPILGPLSLREWRKFHLVHTRHHLAQIRRMRTGGSSTNGSAERGNRRVSTTKQE
ncbi:MAG TPA: DinB family protein [Terriglobales bacterium]|nr:DinB family protein [Terriglobales bacterium]